MTSPNPLTASSRCISTPAHIQTSSPPGISPHVQESSKQQPPQQTPLSTMSPTGSSNASGAVSASVEAGMAAVAPAADTFRVTTTTAPDYVTKTAQLKFAAGAQAAFAFDSNFDSPQPTADVHEERPLSRSSVRPLVRGAALLGAGVHTGPPSVRDAALLGADVHTGPPSVRDAALLGAGVHTGPPLLQFSSADPVLVEKARLPWNAH